MIEYHSSRLCFKANVIEPLRDNDTFLIHTPEGVFQFTKADFYRVFPNVIKSKSYKEIGYYNYSTLPQRALSFLISATVPIPNKTRSNKKITKSQDLIGDDIRTKIKEIGILWHNSPNNPVIKNETLDKWENLIEEWIADETLPLIVRKETSKRGQSLKHPSGREIIISDNTVAIWVYSNVLKNYTPTLSEIKNLLAHNELPIVFMATNEIKAKAKYTKPLGNYALTNWKVCHISSVGFNTNKSIPELELSDIKEHFRKYANPKNMFILPKEIGYLGEISEFIEEQMR